MNGAASDNPTDIPPKRPPSSVKLEDFDLLTISDVAILLRCSKAQVGRIVAGRVMGCERLPSVSLGRRKLVRKEALKLWLITSEASSTRRNAS